MTGCSHSVVAPLPPTALEPSELHIMRTGLD
jgi:hypothetical protein